MRAEAVIARPREANSLVSLAGDTGAEGGEEGEGNGNDCGATARDAAGGSIQKTAPAESSRDVDW